MNLQELQYFVTVADTLNFSRAAEILYVTQPAISRQIALLEKEWNCKLFIREYKTLRLTKEAELYLPIAKRIVNDIQMLNETTASIQSSKNHIRLGYPNMISLNYLTNTIQHLKECYSQLQIDTIYAPTNIDTIYKLENRELDAIITPETFLLDRSDLEYKKIIPGKLAVIINDECELNKKEKIYFSDLNSYNVMIHPLETNSSPYHILLEDCEKYGLLKEKIHTMHTTDEIFMSCASGKGIGLMPSCFIDGRIGKLHVVDIEDSPNYYGAVLAIRKNEDNPIVRTLLNAFK